MLQGFCLLWVLFYVILGCWVSLFPFEKKCGGAGLNCHIARSTQRAPIVGFITLSAFYFIMALEETLYAKSMAEGIPEVVTFDGEPRLKVYRGLEVPERDFVSEGDDRKRTAGTIDLTNPGVDWTPIRKFAEMHAGCNYPDSQGKQVILSALVPLDDPLIINESIANSTLDDEWFQDEAGFIYRPNLEALTDCLIVVVPESRYPLLRDVKVEYTDASFEKV